MREMPVRARFVSVRDNLLQRSRMSSARNVGENTIVAGYGHPSVKIARVECAKCRRERDLFRSGIMFCRDRACRVREMEARIRFLPVAGKLLLRSCVLSARNVGENAIYPRPV